MIEFRDVTFFYGEETAPSVDGVSLKIDKGETVVLCGESGCGKSTMTRLINGLIPHFHEGKLGGEVLYDGKRTMDMRLYELSEHVGSVFQDPRTQFYNVGSTVELAFGCENLGVPPEEIEQRITRTATRFGLEELLDRNLFAMSGGEKQRIACGSVDATNPETLVLDEPSSNLDLFAIHDLAQVVQRWRDDGKTLVIAEHRIFYLVDLADRFIYIRDGRIEREFRPDELRTLSPEALEDLGLRAPDPWKLAPRAEARGSGESLSLRSLKCITRGRRRLSIPELTLPRGEIIAVIGRNGAGKTTLARTLCGLEKTGSGVLGIDGATHDIRKRRDLVYMVMQDVNHQLFTEDVISELLLSMDGTDPDAEQKRAMEILRSLDLDDKSGRHPMSLSGGEQQRVAIGSAIAAGREILILDEPTSGLDHKRMTQVADYLTAMSADGKTMLVITHDIELVLRCCSHAIYLVDGEVAQKSRMDETGAQQLREFFE